MSATGQSSESERAPLLPKAVERDEARDSGDLRSVSVKPEKSQSMVMYVPAPLVNLTRRLSLMMSMLLCGWNAGSLGPLLPALQSYYNVRPAFTWLQLIGLGQLFQKYALPETFVWKDLIR